MPGRAHLLEWGFLGVAVALAGLLVFASVSSWRGDAALTEVLAHGEGERTFHALRDRLPPDRPPGADELAAAVAALAPAGLRHVAILGRAGETLLAAGAPTPGAIDPLASPGPIAPGSVLVIFRPLHPPGPPPGPPSAEHRPPRPPPRVRIEYEPHLALDLRERARRDLLVSLAVAAALLLTAGVFHRLRRRARLAEEGLTERRHLAALGEMSAVLAHEIRNPLASLKGHAQLLEEQLAGDPRRHAKARRIVDEAVRLERLTTSLLDFTRADRIAPAAVDPRSVAQRAAELTEPARVTIDDRAAPATWTLDAMRIEQALVNLLRNALQASPDPAVVELRIADEGDGLRFTVADRGPGVPTDLRPRIFEPFVTGRTQGTGLGLAVVRRVVESHGGKVTIERRPGGGSVFQLWLPPGKAPVGRASIEAAPARPKEEI
jgi:two-component system sensor histidine kinase HydH